MLMTKSVWLCLHTMFHIRHRNTARSSVFIDFPIFARVVMFDSKINFLNTTCQYNMTLLLHLTYCRLQSLVHPQPEVMKSILPMSIVMAFIRCHRVRDRSSGNERRRLGNFEWFLFLFFLPQKCTHEIRRKCQLTELFF